MARSIIEKIQTILGLESDGIWGPKSQTALNKEIGRTDGDGNPVLAKIQKLLDVEDDGRWGPISQQALNDQFSAGALEGGAGGFKAEASSFGDPKDVRDFL